MSQRSSMPAFEQLESRCHLSLTMPAADAVGFGPAVANAKAPSVGPAIRLDLVALHEFGHSLGLDHSSDSSSIMYAYYNPNYNLGNFASDSAVAQFQSMYSVGNVVSNATAWKDSLDAAPGNGIVEVTYSFIRDGASLDSGARNSLFTTFNKKFDVGTWQSIFTDQLARWASASSGTVQFQAFDPDGVENATYSFNISGKAQNDSRFGDIRIGAHRFDRAGGTLAHAYFPPPNGATASGDAHFDEAENWVVASGTTSFATTSVEPTATSTKVAASTSPFASAKPIESVDRSLFGDAVALF